MKWAQLPDEIVLHILSCLPARDIVSCSAMSKQMNALVTNSSYMQLIIELAVYGLREASSATLPRHHHRTAVEKLEAFKRSRQAWERLKPLRRAHIDTIASEYELSEATLAHGLSDDSGKFRGVELFRLWLEQKEDDCKIWRRYDDLGIHVLDFSFDHGEDLLVLVESPSAQSMFGPTAKRVFLRTLSGNLSHPSTQRAFLQSPGEERWAQCEIRICRSILAIHFSDTNHFSPSTGRLTIWDWKTGDILQTRVGVGGYCFLSTEVALVVGFEPWAGTSLTDSKSDSDTKTYRVELQIIDMGNHSTSRTRLALPLLSSPNKVKVTAARPPIDAPTHVTDLKTSPYIHDETAERMVTIVMGDHLLLISAQRLLGLHRRRRVLSFSEEDVEKEAHYTWPEWGPDSSFWLLAPYLFLGWVCIDGARFITMSAYTKLFTTDKKGYVKSTTLKLDIGMSPHLKMLMLDFNPRPIRRAQSLGHASGSKGQGMLQEWRRRHPDFDQEVVSRLPFRVFQGPLRDMPDELIVGMDHVVASMRDGYEVMQFTD